MNIKIIAILFVLAGLTACTGQKTKSTTPPPVNDPPRLDVQDDVIATEIEPLDDGNAIASDDALSIYAVLDDPTSPLSNKVIYFDFNQSQVRAEFDAILAAHADFLRSHPDVTVLLEGYCDERGTREYNLALGEKRGLSVGEYLLVVGVSDAQIETVSFGEENPVADAHNETAWAQNRRVHLVYPGR